MRRYRNRNTSWVENLMATVLFLIAILGCSLALFGPPSTLSAGFDSYVRTVPGRLPVEGVAPTLRLAESVAPKQLVSERPHLRESRLCSPVVRAELRRLSSICH